MKKHIKASLILLALAVLVIVSCFVIYFLTAFTKRTGYHISELTLEGQNLYFGAGHCLYCLDTQNQALHELQCEKGYTFGQPAVEGERAYAQVGQFLVAVDLSSREIVWRTDQSVEPGFEYETSTAFLHSPRSTLLAEGIVTTSRRQGLQFYDAQSGNLICRTEPNWMASYRYLLDDKLIWYIVKSIDELDYGYLKGVAVNSGEVQYVIDLRPAVRFDELLAIDKQWIFGAMDEGENRRYIFAINREQLNQVQWFSEIYFQLEVSRPVLYDNLFIVRIDYSTVYALDINTGQVVWSFTPGTSPVASDDVAQPTLFLLCELADEFHNCRLYALDAATGGIVWEYNLNAGFYEPTVPVISGGAVYIGNHDSIEILELGTGELLQRIQVDSEYEFYVSKSGL